jgi:hypothetical protein
MRNAVAHAPLGSPGYVARLRSQIGIRLDQARCRLSDRQKVERDRLPGAAIKAERLQ